MPSLVGATTAGGWQTATTLTAPTGARARDTLLVWLSANDEATVTPPDGWELADSIVGGDLGALTGVYLYTRTATTADVADPPVEYTWTWGGEHWHHGICVATRGVGTVPALALAADEATDTLPLPTLPAVGGDMLLGFGYHWGTTPGTEPTFAGLDTVAAQDSILVAAMDSATPDGPTDGYVCTSTEVGRMAVGAVLLRQPAWEPLPVQQPLPPKSAWRYYAFNALTGAQLDSDLPLGDVRITQSLSGPTRITATIDPEFEDLKTPAGDLVLSEWQTLIVAEASGQLRAGGLLTQVDTVGPKLTLEITGVSGYAEAQPIRSTLSWGGKTGGLTGEGVDPLDVVRAVWDYLQSQPDGNIGVTLDDTTTPYRLGEWTGGIRKIEEDGSLGPAKEVQATPIPIDRIWNPKKDRKPVAATGKSVYWQYSIPWWDDIEAGQRITQLGTQTGFEYLEHYSWDTPGETVVRHIRLGYPRLGRRQTRLTFTEGENVIDLVPVRRDGNDYANLVVVYGAGEGSKKVRGSYSTRDGRPLRAKSVDRPDLTSAAACTAVAKEELLRWSRITDITGFTATDHPNAPIGTFGPGDDVLVETRTGWTQTRLWVRITDMTISPGSDQVSVTCRRSDRFSYPGGV